MKVVRVFLLLFLFLLGLGAGLWLFLPWNQAAQALFDETAGRLERQGVEMTALEVSGRGGLRPLFLARGLSLSHPFLKVNAALVEGRLDLLSSILSRSLAVDLAVGPGDLILLQGHRASWNAGRLLLKARPRSVDVFDVDLSGALSVKGAFSFDPTSSALTRASLDIGAPAELDPVLTGLRALLPIKKEGEGRWKVTRP
ncbi:hypothetical protein [Aminirod propionatiphilus]|uniref:Uncharacterized protein n=1 Tax=Aminirod propionatiphilus TaxID=3415223 RepID=A0ACD1DY10_9BACT|nr:hypothetical protein KIH16_04880 [Synergistota bacterium]